MGHTAVEQMGDVRRPAPLDPHGRVVILGDDGDWVRTAARLVIAGGLVPETRRLNETSEMAPPLVGVLIHLHVADSETTGMLETLAKRALSRQCVVSLATFAGAADYKHAISDLGYERTLIRPPRPRTEGRYWSAMSGELARLGQEHLSLIPQIALALGSSEVELLRLVEAVLVPRPTNAVTTWRKRLGCTRDDLVGRLDGIGFPQPKATLDTIRLALAVQIVLVTGDGRDKVARACAFSSGDYLGRRSKALTGLSFGDLVHRGLGPVLARLKVG